MLDLEQMRSSRNIIYPSAKLRRRYYFARSHRLTFVQWFTDDWTPQHIPLSIALHTPGLWRGEANLFQGNVRRFSNLSLTPVTVDFRGFIYRGWLPVLPGWVLIKMPANGSEEIGEGEPLLIGVWVYIWKLSQWICMKATELSLFRFRYLVGVSSLVLQLP